MEAFLLRCAYAMALVRFVNGMLDPFQQGAHAVALLTIAKSIGLSLSFVDLRHSATHGPLPTLDLLRALTEKALEWLHDHYWGLLVDGGAGEEDESVDDAKPPDILVTLRVYKKLRKQNLDAPLSGQGKACLDTLVQMSEDPARCGTLAEYLCEENFLVKESLKFKTAVKIYGPLFENGLRALLLAVVVGLIHHCSGYCENAFCGGKLERAQSWTGHLVPLLLSSVFPIENTHYGTLDKAETVQVIRLALGLVEGSPLAASVEDAISEKPKKFFLPPLLDEILASPSELSKDPSVEPSSESLSLLYQPGAKRQKRPVLFHTHSDWTLSPFGVCP